MRFFKKQLASHPIQNALLQLAPKSVVMELASKVPPAELIQAVALSICQKPELLLDEVAQILSLKSCHSITVIDKTVIGQCGFSQEVLSSRAIFVAPDITAKHNFSFIIADPKQIALAEFIEHGHLIKLALGTTIAAAWTQFQRFSSAHYVSLSEQQLFNILHALAATAKQHGATSLKIIASNDPHYLFHVGAKEYRGSLQQSVLDAIAYYTQDNTSFSDREISSAQSLTVIKTKRKAVVEFEINWDAATPTAAHPLYAKSHEQKPQSVQEVVIIDDEQRFANLLKSMLQAKDYQVTCFADAREALEAITTKAVSNTALLVCDVHMPIIDGPTLVRSLRDAGCQQRIVMLTSDDDELLEAEMALMGIDAFVKKQSNPKVLLAWLQNLATKQQLTTVNVTDNRMRGNGAG